MPITQGYIFPQAGDERVECRDGSYTMLRNPALSGSPAAVIGLRQTSTPEALYGLDTVPDLPNIAPMTQYSRLGKTL